MTESEWLGSDDLLRLLVAHKQRVSQRKRRLLACACCRFIWDRLRDERSRRAVEVAERLADGEITEPERRGAFEAALRVAPLPGRDLAHLATVAVAHDSDYSLLHLTEEAAPAAAEWLRQAGLGERYRELAGLLRELVGNPYRPARVDETWLAWSHGFIPRFARTIYEERSFEQLPILADALEDAGCDEPELLGHLRGPGPHLRGCWALDLMLGKE